jgi:hypothetical protein
MGTMADFYIGRGPDAEWLGSVKMDGYQWGDNPDCPLMVAKERREFCYALTDIIADDPANFCHPGRGWPWPWTGSHTTDCVYAFVDGRALYLTGEDKKDFPDMSKSPFWRGSPESAERTRKREADLAAERAGRAPSEASFTLTLNFPKPFEPAQAEQLARVLKAALLPEVASPPRPEADSDASRFLRALIHYGARLRCGHDIINLELTPAGGICRACVAEPPRP